jgi:inner membrane protein
LYLYFDFQSTFKMENKKTFLPLRLWMLTSLCLGLGVAFYYLFDSNTNVFTVFILVFLFAAVGSLPALLFLHIAIYKLEESNYSKSKKIRLLFTIGQTITSIYGCIAGLFSVTENDNHWFYEFGKSSTLYGLPLSGAFTVAMLLSLKKLNNFFTNSYSSLKTIKMETNEIRVQTNEPSHANKILFKGIITAGLILGMLIPMMFVSNLVLERENRNKEVVEEVNNKWSSAQTITGPYLYLAYDVTDKSKDDKPTSIQKHLFILPENMNVSGSIIPETRARSIYKVLLYKSDLKSQGNFNIKIPKEIDLQATNLKEAKICFGLSDYKGIEEKLVINFNGTDYELSPGLPNNSIDSIGLSAPVILNTEDFKKTIAYNFSLKLKGSEQLHFVPLSGTSSFNLQSNWRNPSFDGNVLPDTHDISIQGFTAKWSFNKANLPFSTILTDANIKKESYAFGVTMVQPADQYAKTNRCVKYALLFLGLTFGLFFIIELIQNKPVHPVQYLLVGIALIVFYTLLLSVSEFILFDYAYLIASLATILLITFYANSHFKKWKTALVFAAVLSILYSFIFILIRLEDTALLVGSIGLFIVLALIMYASRKINWYQPHLSLQTDNL